MPMSWQAWVELLRQQELGLIAHDAGAGQLLARMARDDFPHARLSMSGPSNVIMHQVVRYPRLCSIAETIRESSVVVVGTGWASSEEFFALGLAQALNRRVISLVDHWGEYTERFHRVDHQLYPQEVWVTDDIAEQGVKASFPNSLVYQIPSPLTRELRSLDHKRSIGANTPLRILLVTEPIAEHEMTKPKGLPRKAYDEFLCLEYALEQIGKVVDPSKVEVCIRLHPAEARDKYDAHVIGHPHLRITKSKEPSLTADLILADIVIGAETTALALAFDSGISSFTMVPPSLGCSALPRSDLTVLSAESLLDELHRLSTRDQSWGPS